MNLTFKKKKKNCLKENLSQKQNSNECNGSEPIPNVTDTGWTKEKEKPC